MHASHRKHGHAGVDRRYFAANRRRELRGVASRPNTNGPRTGLLTPNGKVDHRLEVLAQPKVVSVLHDSHDFIRLVSFVLFIHNNVQANRVAPLEEMLSEVLVNNRHSRTGWLRTLDAGSELLGWIE